MGAGDGAIFARKRVEVNGHQVSYLVGGREGDMEPVLYLHGMGGAGKWEAFHMAIGTVAHAFAPQLPGWTAGEPPEGIESVKDYADLVLGFLDAAELEKVALMGHSIGGWMALHLATQHPERVSRLVLADSMGLDLPASPVADLDEISEESFGQKVFAKLGMVATPDAYGFGADWQNVRQGPEFERQWKGRDMVAKLLKGSYSDPALTAAIPGIDVETLLVWGRIDGIVPLAHGENLRQTMPQSHLAVMDEVGHLPMAEKPETFHRLLRDFLLRDEGGEELPGVLFS